MNKFLLLFSGLWFIFWLEQGFFRVSERYYCKKNRGDCSKCKAWSCLKGHYEYKK